MKKKTLCFSETLLSTYQWTRNNIPEDWSTPLQKPHASHVWSNSVSKSCYVLSVRLSVYLNRLTPNDPYMGRTAQVTSKRCILYIYSTNIGTEYLKHALYSPFFSLQNAVYFIMLTCLVPVLFTFYIQDVLKLKNNNSGAKELSIFTFK